MKQWQIFLQYNIISKKIGRKETRNSARALEKISVDHILKLFEQEHLFSPEFSKQPLRLTHSVFRY